MIKFLLKCKADPNLICKNGTTALHEAFKVKNFEIIMLLLD